jgi:hypothetical protein
MNSDYVREEYSYALTLRREGFVRPVFWEEPLPESKEKGLPPPELQKIHFHRIAPITQPEKDSLRSGASGDRIRTLVFAAPPPLPATHVPAAPPPRSTQAIWLALLVVCIISAAVSGIFAIIFLERDRLSVALFIVLSVTILTLARWLFKYRHRGSG